LQTIKFDFRISVIIFPGAAAIATDLLAFMIHFPNALLSARDLHSICNSFTFFGADKISNIVFAIKSI